MASGNWEDARCFCCCCSRLMPPIIHIHIVAPASHVQIGVLKRDYCLFSASRYTLQ
jgi:hypothetical protein